jgi:hypothetical protein
MFCSTCGAALTRGLSYCNHCGAKVALSTNPLEQSSAPPDKLAETVFGLTVISGVVAIAGFIFVFLLVEKLLDRMLSASAVMAFMMISLAAVVGISWLFIRQLLRTLNVYLRIEDKAKRPAQLDERPAPQLEAAPREPAASVTDHTTRAFEPALRERKN